MRGMLEALRILKDMSLVLCAVEGDSSLVISWGQGKAKGSWRLRYFICEARNLMIELKVDLNHVPRSQNDMAHRLAKWSVNRQDIFLGNHFPEC